MNNADPPLLSSLGILALVNRVTEDDLPRPPNTGRHFAIKKRRKSAGVTTG
jgi:hypothetical protein